MKNIQSSAADRTQRHQNRLARDLHGAAIIDASGREIPMTEEMIDSALEQLSAQWDSLCNSTQSFPYNLAR